jgi:hypothetical protein
MPEKQPTLNRFLLFGLFAHQAARHMGYPEDDARLLGYSTALLKSGSIASIWKSYWVG